MTENEIREYIEELRHNANMLIKSGYATTGISTHFSKSADLIEELLAYRTIGTVEQCREAAEKMKPKKPIDRCMFKECPVCGNVEIEHCNHCTDCGQALDWSDIPEKENT